MLKVGDVVEILDNNNMYYVIEMNNCRIGSRHIVTYVWEHLDLPAVILDGNRPCNKNAWYSHRFKFVDHIELDANTNIEELLHYNNI